MLEFETQNDAPKCIFQDKDEDQDFQCAALPHDVVLNKDPGSVFSQSKNGSMTSSMT